MKPIWKLKRLKKIYYFIIEIVDRTKKDFVSVLVKTSDKSMSCAPLNNIEYMENVDSEAIIKKLLEASENLIVKAPDNGSNKSCNKSFDADKSVKNWLKSKQRKKTTWLRT